ncbi:class I SAM-dependent methyltransferase [Aquabacterium humicola]|uniref:class I SAM-dependent methyltransferase n=1 Tax=Aquabacterium humicola TaxID=3237377 RepID=UPI00254278EB|nr:class I SAM-dependent methyltransferase [Rubrivivax pictus]
MTTPTTADQDLAAYYAKRAAEYEAIYAKPERQAELRALEAELPGFFAGRCVLEIACGTGWWTLHGARDAAHWLATDLNPETMAVARSKPLPASVELRTLDAYSFEGLAEGERFDAAFAGHWWSHVPRQRLIDWIEALHARLVPGARIVMLDNQYAEGSSTPLARSDEHGNTYQQRRLADGSVHEVLKNFPTRDEAIAAIGPHVRDVDWSATRHYWRLSYQLA